MYTRKKIFKLSLAGILLSTTGIYGALEYYKRKKHVLDIIIYPNKILRQVAEPVKIINDKTISLSDRIIATLKYHTITGIFNLSIPKGIAAPQLGIGKRIIACGITGSIEILVNPEIVDKKEKYTGYEECLSLPEYDGCSVTRAGSVRVKYTGLDKKEKILTAYGRYAALVQHEIDHLDGKLYIDYNGHH